MRSQWVDSQDLLERTQQALLRFRSKAGDEIRQRAEQASHSEESLRLSQEKEARLLEKLQKVVEKARQYKALAQQAEEQLEQLQVRYDDLRKSAEATGEDWVAVPTDLARLKQLETD